MQKNIFQNLLIFSVLIVSSACSTQLNNVPMMGEIVELRHATHLKIQQLDSCTLVQIINPWDTTQLLHSYVIVHRDSVLPSQLPNATLVRTPINNALVYTSVHLGLIENLGAIAQVGGVCDADYILQPLAKQLVKNGTIRDVGNSMSPNIETIIALSPDAILLSPFENSGGYGAIEKLGVPIIECADYMEVSPLACAEWMLFYGLLFGKENVADSLFRVVEENYCRLRDSVALITDKPSLVVELKSGSAWYVPSARSTTGRFYIDAGANYLFANITKNGAVPLAFETVYETAYDADFWLFKYNRPTNITYQQLSVENQLYSEFTAFKNKNIYACNTFSSPYYDQVPFRPDWLLRDLVAIFYPNLLPNYNLRYYSKLTD